LAWSLLLTGERVDASRAEAMRLVWKVVEHDRLLAAANDLATRLCKSAPLAVRATKEVAHRTRAMPWVEAVRFGETMRKVANQTDDAAEARRAAAEGRPPVWRGE
jgi:enoyl-CoA hydratase/carnithine racemase